MLITIKDERGIPQVRSDATNAYDLCYDVAACIRAEPRRYDQGTWYEKREGEGAPPCGTVACRAGWMCFLTGQSMNMMTIEHQAMALLGDAINDKGWLDLTTEEQELHRSISLMFGGGALSRENPEYEGPLNIGPEAAELGAKGLEKFAERWKERLLATPVRRSDDRSEETGGDVPAVLGATDAADDSSDSSSGE